MKKEKCPDKVPTVLAILGVILYVLKVINCKQDLVGTMAYNKGKIIGYFIKHSYLDRIDVLRHMTRLLA